MSHDGEKNTKPSKVTTACTISTVTLRSAASARPGRGHSSKSLALGPAKRCSIQYKLAYC